MIDELSMVSQTQFTWMDRMRRQESSITEEHFGGIFVIMTGDPVWLPPIGRRALHAKNARDQLTQKGFQAF